MTEEGRKLADVIAKIIEDRRSSIVIHPTWVATEAMLTLDPEHLAPELVRLGCHLQLRQIARELCRRKFEDAVGGESAQHEMFPELQVRYPTARSARREQPEYVLLEYMTEADVVYNVGRLRLEANAKNRHADALWAWDRARRKRA